MSKVKAKKMNLSSNKAKPQSEVKHKKEKKKKSWKHVELSTKVKIQNVPVLPPKDCKDFSANWRKLQETLKGKDQQTKGQEKDLDSSKENIHKKALKDIPVKSIGDKIVKAKSGDTEEKRVQKGKAPVQTKQPKAQKRKRVDLQTCAGNIRQNKKFKVKEETEKKISEEDIWFDDVDPDDIEATLGKEAADIVRAQKGIKKDVPSTTESSLVKVDAFDGLTRAVAIDCEMVGVGPDGQDSILARVSLVNQFGKCIYDKYVKPTQRVTDYRTEVSGIRPKDIKHGEAMKTVQKEVAEILKGRILVGHAIRNDLKCLFLDHPKKNIRDTQTYKPFKKIVKSSRPSLQLLCEKIVNIKIQQGEHSSVLDAQATMRLYTLVKKQWETAVKQGLRYGETEESKSGRRPQKKTSATLKKPSFHADFAVSV